MKATIENLTTGEFVTFISDNCYAVYKALFDKITTFLALEEDIKIYFN